jgi:UDP-N-acetylmuramyl pentapeptide phosphotransferase/UDP-N-acetylglucosamine-1-phosphate transferase
MDGINGMTGLYNLIVLISLQYLNWKIVSFTPPDFINLAILATVVFLFFNFRKRALCFSGDVGSMALSFWIITLLLQLMIKTESLIWILFLAVYGIDSVCTILHRLYLKQNIFEAHRLHFYQILSNERGISHLKVSAIYAAIQLLICGIICYTFFNSSLIIMWIIGSILLFILCIAYLQKFRLLQSRKTSI